MSWLLGMGSGGGGGKPPNPMIAGSGKWLSIFVGLYAAVFWTVDIWEFLEPQIIDMIHDRYEGMLAEALYWILRLAAYPLVFFAVKMTLGIVFVSLVMGVMTKIFGGRR